jgi:uncharacterized membrane protein YphA (DoxX/SURF4 family)
MNRYRRLARMTFALGMMGTGVLPLVYGYAALLYQPAPAWVPAPEALGIASGILMIVTGAGLLFERTTRASIRILLPFLLLWTLTRVPAPFADPLREINWFAIGEVAVLAAGALVIFVQRAGLRPGSGLQHATAKHGLRAACILLGLSLVTYGLSHFFEFRVRTISLVPAWLPFRPEWAYLVGAGQVACGLGVLFGVYPRLAATTEATMLSMFTLLVWVPAVVTRPGLASNWGEGVVTAALAGAVWVVAESIPVRGADRRLGDRPAD